MNQTTLTKSWLRPRNLFLLTSAVLAFGTGCKKDHEQGDLNFNNLGKFRQQNLIANKTSYNPTLKDSSLQNAWGLAFSSTGVPWVNSTNGHVSEVYTADGAIARAGVYVPSPADSTHGAPTGVVFCGGKGFKLPNNQGANFLFVGADGILSGWNGGAGNYAFRLKNNSTTSSYTGLALAAKGNANYIYAANFKAHRIDVWDTTFSAVAMTFTDPGIPSDYAPFNIQAIGTSLYVAYAKVGSDGDEVKQVGAGYVSIFNTDGSFVKRLASGGKLNAPWGVAQAPAGFVDDNTAGGTHVDKDQPTILVGNFGDGRINIFSMDGTFLGQMRANDQTIAINGLWALSFAPSTATTVDPNRLYFTAGPVDETDGLFGYLIRQ